MKKNINNEPHGDNETAKTAQNDSIDSALPYGAAIDKTAESWGAYAQAMNKAAGAESSQEYATGMDKAAESWELFTGDVQRAADNELASDSSQYIAEQAAMYAAEAQRRADEADEFVKQAKRRETEARKRDEQTRKEAEKYAKQTEKQANAARREAERLAREAERLAEKLKRDNIEPQKPHKEKNKVASKSSKDERGREHLLDIAETIVSIRSIKETSLADIAKAADISKGTLYYYFPTKEELVLDIAKRYITKLEVSLSAGVCAEPEQLCSILTALFWRAPQTSRLHTYLLHEAVSGNVQLQKLLLKYYNELHNYITTALSACFSTQDAANRATAVIALIDGFTALQLNTPFADIAAARAGIYTLYERI